MSAAMGGFRITIEIENPIRPGPRETLENVLVDTGAELSWIPSRVLESLGIERRKAVRFRQADGTILTRWTGTAWVYAGGTSASDDVVFGEDKDLVLLGARSLEGLNLRVDPVTKTLVDAGPVPAAVGGEGGSGEGGRG
jgi:predicted aspartyl protease